MFLVYKVKCFIGISGCEIIYDNFTCPHVKIIAFQTITNHSFCTFYIGGKPVVYIINRKIHGCMEIPDLFLVLNIYFSVTPSLRLLVRSHVQHSK